MISTKIFGIVLNIVTTTSFATSFKMKDPNLHQILTGIANCDIQIIHNLLFPSEQRHFYFLPTTIFYIRPTPNFKPSLLNFTNIYKTRSSFCRLIYIILESGGEPADSEYQKVAVDTALSFDRYHTKLEEY